MSLILLEGCEDNRWFGAGTIVAARTGNGWTATPVTIPIPAAQEADCVTIGFAFNCADLTDGFFLSLRASGQPTAHNTLLFNGDGTLAVRRGLTTISGPTASIVSEGVWHYVEWAIRVHASLGVSTVRLDGEEVLTFSGNTIFAGWPALYQLVQFGTVAIPIVDDLYLCTATTTPDAFLGDLSVDTLYPDGNGDTSQWVGSDGNSTDNYLLVDEVTPTSADYVGSATVGHQDLYQIGATHTDRTGMPIIAVCHAALAARTDTVSPRGLKLVNKRGAVNTGPAIALSTTYYTVGYGLTTDPETGAAWTAANIDALQSGVEVT